MMVKNGTRSASQIGQEKEFLDTGTLEPDGDVGGHIPRHSAPQSAGSTIRGLL